MMKRRNLSAIFVLIAVLCLSGCDRIMETYGRISGDFTPPAPVAPVFAVNTMLAVQGPIQDYLALTGDIIASSTVDTFSDTAGRVSRVYVNVGSTVRRGDPVVAVDPSRPGMEFVQSIVRAPVAGTIVALPAQLGMTISPAVPLARIAGAGGLEIRLFVAERFISRITMNQICEITLDAWPGHVFRGAIREISPTVDPVSRTMEIRVAVDNPGDLLKAGMFAKVQIIVEQRENIVKIPISGTVNRFGEQIIFVVDNSDPEGPVARRRYIVPGIQIDGVLEIREGLAPNEEVVIRGQALLDDGSRINIVDRLTPFN
ncbi:MAG: efflux RND transporter periplasmic adaptor subunit [Treponema sp.]|nr:efflux RND transporter periplasmic adaptor subunit [Treponema sp.]